MTEHPKNDRDLIAFIRQHRPEPPPPAPDLEQCLLQRIERPEPPTALFARPQPRSRRVWATTGAIAASVLLAWSGYRALEVSQQFAQDRQLQDEQLATFLFENWQEVLERDSSSSLPTASSELAWFALTDSQFDSPASPDSFE